MPNRLMDMDRIWDRRLLDRFTRAQSLRRSQDGIFNGWISCTATERILQRKTDFISGGRWIALDQCMGRHDLPGDAESALHRAVFHEGFLQRVQFHLFMDALGKPLDRN